MVGAVPVDEIGFGNVGFAPDAVEAFVGAFVDVPFLNQLTPEFVDGRPMAFFIGGADKVVVADIELFIEVDKFLGVLVDQCLDVDTLLLRQLVDFGTVFVGSGKPVDVVAQQTVVAGDRVSLDEFEGVADVRRAIHVSDGGGDVEFVGHDIFRLRIKV